MGTRLDVQHSENKKAFQSNYNRTLHDSLGYTVNKFEHVWMGQGSLYGEVHVKQVCMVRGTWLGEGGGGPQLKKFQHVWGGDHHYP